MKGFLAEFRDFVMRGNVVDLAVAVIIGAAFTAVVTSFSNDILMQVVAGIFGEPDFNSLTWTVGGVVLKYGSFLTALVNFVIVAFVLFLVVKAMNAAVRKKKKEYQPSGPTEVELLTQIRDALRGRAD